MRRVTFLKTEGARSRILSYFMHRQNYRLIEGNLKITLYKDRKTIKEIIINHKGTRMVNWHGLQTTNLKSLAKTFHTA